jgi:DNA modification methylase
MNIEKSSVRGLQHYPLVQQIEVWQIDKLIPYAKNPRTPSDAQVAQIAGSIAAFGFNAPILVDSNAGVIAGHGRLLASRQLGLQEVPVIVLDHLSEIQRRAYLIADNKLGENAGWDDDLLREQLADLRDADIGLETVGFADDELRELLAAAENDPVPSDEAEIPEAPTNPVTRPGDIWQIRRHRLICGDCRDPDVVGRLFDGAQANMVFTSPPYATQREYDPSSGFQPVRPEEYCNWFRDVARNIATVLAADGSYFLNIKEHAEDGERSLYVKDLVIAHQRQWGWRFVDELCWRKTDNGVPGGWNNRFKNAWEPVFHFCRQPQIKFRPKEVSHMSEDCFEYSANNPKSTSGSGLLGTGARGAAADQAGPDTDDGRFTGLARPSNVIEIRTECGQGSHSAPFPRALVEFFLKAFSDAGDVVFDPFLGSGSTMAAAEALGRTGFGVEISPAYCDVALRRIATLSAEQPVLAATGQSIAEVATERGVEIEPAESPRNRDGKRIRHNGPAPFYGSRRKAG